MCLSRVLKVYDLPLEEEQWAWGVFHKDFDDPGCLTFEFCSHKNERRVPRGEWLEAENVHALGEQTIHAGNGAPYPVGFHKFLSRDNAEWWRWPRSNTGFVTLPVKVRGICAIGESDLPPSRVIIARWMYVPLPEEVEAFTAAALEASPCS